MAEVGWSVVIDISAGHCSVPAACSPKQWRNRTLSGTDSIWINQTICYFTVAEHLSRTTQRTFTARNRIVRLVDIGCDQLLPRCLAIPKITFATSPRRDLAIERKTNKDPRSCRCQQQGGKVGKHLSPGRDIIVDDRDTLPAACQHSTSTFVDLEAVTTLLGLLSSKPHAVTGHVNAPEMSHGVCWDDQSHLCNMYRMRYRWRTNAVDAYS